MADVEIIETYTPFCFDCGWEGETYDLRSDARIPAYAHKCTVGLS